MLKARLREIASSQALRTWASACPASTFVGVCRVETQHATYLFRNGSCFAGTSKGERAGRPTDLVGMKIAGWLLTQTSSAAMEPASLDANGKVEVSRNWRPGARAVLTSKGRLFSGPRTALTSPVTSFTHFADPTVARPHPPAHVSSTSTGTSMTRIHAAAAI
jgi:hypothetical protein